MSISQGEYDFKMDWHTAQLYLKVKHPLRNMLVQSTTEGERISCGSAQWSIPLRIVTPSVKHLQYISHMGGGIFNASGQVLSTRSISNYGYT